MGSQFFLYNPSTKGDSNNSSLDDTILWSLWLTIWQLWNPSLMLPMVLRYGYRDRIYLIQPAYRKSHLLSNTNFPYDYSGYLLSVGPTFIHSFIPLRFLFLPSPLPYPDIHPRSWPSLHPTNSNSDWLNQVCIPFPWTWYWLRGGWVAYVTFGNQRELIWGYLLWNLEALKCCKPLCYPAEAQPVNCADKWSGSETAKSTQTGLGPWLLIHF